MQSDSGVTWFHTDRVESKSAGVPVGFSYSLNTEHLKNSKAMGNFNMLVLHTVMWGRRWRRKRRNMWVHPINIKRPQLGIFSRLYRDLVGDLKIFMAF